MKLRARTLSVMLATCLSWTAMAAWEPPAKLTYLETGEAVRIKTNSMNLASGCCTYGGEYELERSNVNYQAVLSLLLAAKVSGTPTRVELGGCVASGYKKFGRGIYKTSVKM